MVEFGGYVLAASKVWKATPSDVPSGSGIPNSKAPKYVFTGSLNPYRLSVTKSMV
jgi:hypothetical protein